LSTPIRKINKRALIQEYAKGKNFIDLGGLWGVKGEMVTSAAKGNAASLAIGDILPLRNRHWAKMDDHLAAAGIADYGKHQIDIMKFGKVKPHVGKFNFVHCSGIMYHVVDVFEFVANLLAMTDDYLLVGSVVVPEDVIGHDGAHCAGASTPDQTERVSEWLKDAGLMARGVSKEAAYTEDMRPVNGPWWWVFTSGFMLRVMESFDVDIIEHGYSSDNAYVVLLRKRQPA
jgi:hypothetical protein